MEKRDSIEETLAPLSRWIAKAFFGEKYGRTWSQQVEDEKRIPKSQFHTMIFGGLVLGALWLNSRK